MANILLHLSSCKHSQGAEHLLIRPCPFPISMIVRKRHNADWKALVFALVWLSNYIALVTTHVIANVWQEKLVKCWYLGVRSYNYVISKIFVTSIKTSGSELWGQKEVACMRIFRPTWPLLWLFTRMATPKL